MPNRLFLLLFSAVIQVYAAGSLKVLWLGNSLTASEFSRCREVTLCGDERATPVYNRYGTYMAEPVDGWNNGTANKDLVRANPWDVVVVQVFGTDVRQFTVNAGDQVFQALRNWDGLIDSIGAKTVFYLPWSVSSTIPVWDGAAGEWKRPDVLDTALMKLKALCTETGAAMLPAGVGQWEIQKRDPSIPTYVDWVHGTAQVGYLSGLLCFSMLTGQDPHGISNFYSLDSQSVFFLQQLAWQISFRPDIEPYSLPSTKAPSADGLALSTLGGMTRVEKYQSADIIGNIHFTDSSVLAGTNKLLFRSLTPSIMSVNHFGRVYARDTGIAYIEALAGSGLDTITIAVVESVAAVFDSIRISPRVFAEPVTNLFHFTATGYAGVSPGTDLTAQCAWISGDTSVFTLFNGIVVKKNARGGPLFAAILMDGLTDTVRFDMVQDIPFILRVNFRSSDTACGALWKRDSGLAFTDSVGFGWVDSAYPGGEGTYRIKCHDGDYMVRMGLGNPDSAVSGQRSYVRYGTDTLFSFVSCPDGPKTGVKTDTIIVRGEQGIFLNVAGPITYLVIVTSAGVDMDSVAFDGCLPPAVETATPRGRGGALQAFPSPFNPEVVFTLSGREMDGASLKVFDMAGRLMADLSGRMKDGRTKWNASGMSSGIYAAVARNGNKTLTKKIMYSR